MQLFVRDLNSRTHVCQVLPEWLSENLVNFVQKSLGYPSTCQDLRLLYGGKLVGGSKCISSFLEADSTLHVVSVLQGGKGGFGALLRIVGRDGKKTTNFSACRDLQGRRLRVVEGEKKLQEWEGQAKDRELEALAAKHIKEVEKKARREEGEKVDVDALLEEQQVAVDRVKDALESVFSGAGPVKAPKRASAPVKEEPQKKAKFMPDLDSFESEDETESGSASDLDEVPVVGSSSKALVVTK